MTQEQAEQTIESFINLVGIDFHIDTPFTEYESRGKRSFSDTTAALHQTKLDEACHTLEVLAIDPYEVALNIMVEAVA